MRPNGIGIDVIAPKINSDAAARAGIDWRDGLLPRESGDYREILFAYVLDLLNDVEAYGFGDVDAGAGFKDEVQAGVAVVEQRCGMLAVGAGRGVGDVVCRGK